MRKIVVAISLIMAILLTACGGSSASASASASSSASNEPQQQTVSEPIKETDQDPIAEAPQAEDDPEDTESAVGIIGSNINDICINLEQRGGIPNVAAQKAPDEALPYYYWSVVSSLIDEDVGVMYDYSLTADKDYQLIGGTFGITNLGDMPDDLFQQLASAYLGFCSTIPYDASNTGTVKPWLELVLPEASSEGSETIAFGDAQFTVYNLGSQAWLEIDKYVED